jgi:hypothetical protein
MSAFCGTGNKFKISLYLSFKILDVDKKMTLRKFNLKFAGLIKKMTSVNLSAIINSMHFQNWEFCQIGYLSVA